MYLIHFFSDAFFVIILEELFDFGCGLDDLWGGLYGLIYFCFDLVLVTVCHLESTYIISGCVSIWFKWSRSILAVYWAGLSQLVSFYLSKFLPHILLAGLPPSLTTLWLKQVIFGIIPFFRFGRWFELHRSWLLLLPVCFVVYSSSSGTYWLIIRISQS